VPPISTFERGGVYQCKQDTHLIDYKLTKKKSGYKILQRAIRLREGEFILCLDVHDKNGQVEAILLVRDEVVHIQEHNSTLRALQKALVKVDR
jgi:hypothetical protein